jgi:protein-S-isoprenylcysteine O-methyltransferase Ste14
LNATPEHGLATRTLNDGGSLPQRIVRYSTFRVERILTPAKLMLRTVSGRCAHRAFRRTLTIHISNDPRLSENRTKAGPAAEQRPIQKIIVLASGLPGLAAFIVPGLDRRFGWSDLPPWLSIAGDLMILTAMWMAFRVFRENAFGSATVQVASGQKVISTGPYALVRHPMYASAAVYFVGAALALGSAWGLVPALLTIAGLVFRLFDEEGFLAANLPGYTDYCAKVRWRLRPGVF